MYMPKNGKLKSKPKSSKSKRTRKSNPKPSKTLVKQVKSILHKEIETKTSYIAINNASTNQQISQAGDCLQILPNVSVGTADNNRIGDTIRAQRLRIKGFITTVLNQTGAGACRLGMRMMIVQPKQFQDLAFIQSSTWLTYLLKKGGATGAFTGVIPDLMADINREAVTVYYDKVFYINSPYLLTAVGDVTVSNSVKFFSHTMKLNYKQLKYDSNVNSGLTPVNFNPVILLGYVHLDGSVTDLIPQLNLSADCYLDYEDA